jgi:hypothetical protein
MNISQYILHSGFGTDVFELPFDIFDNEAYCIGNEFGYDIEEGHWDDSIYKNYLLLRKYY